MTRKLDEAANFVFVQLIEQSLVYVYEKCHPDYVRQDKIYLAWKKFTEMRETGI
jgi:hypothetical protein